LRWSLPFSFQLAAISFAVTGTAFRLLPKGCTVAEKPVRPTEKGFKVFPMAVGATGSLFAASAKGFAPPGGIHCRAATGFREPAQGIGEVPQGFGGLPKVIGATLNAIVARLRGFEPRPWTL
jgi:hypothetical protein